jgi:integrase
MTTDISVRSIVRRAKEKRGTIEVRLGDGLELRAGARKASFSLKFVDRRTHRQQRITLGYYPGITLAEARRRAKEHQARIEDPQVRANPAKERRDRTAMSCFRELAEKRLVDEQLAPNTREYYRWCLQTYAYGAIGDMAVADVRTDDVIAIVDAVARRAPSTADRVQTVISSVFSWAMRERIVALNPARGITRRAANIPRNRVPDDADLRLILKGIYSTWQPTASPDLRQILLLLLLTGARSSEVRLAERDDLRWEGYAGFRGPVWVVPGDELHRGRRIRGRTKSGRQKVLPLSHQAAELFRRSIAASSGRQRLFDVAEKRAVSYALARICSRVRLVGDQRITPHDFRRAVSTWLGDRGERPDVIEAIADHAPHGVTRVHYNLSLLLPMVANAMQLWADHVQSLMPAPSS